MITPLENFNKLPTRQGNRKHINLSEPLKIVTGAPGCVSQLYIIIHPVMVIDATEYNSAEILSVLSKRQVVSATGWLCAAPLLKKKKWMLVPRMVRTA